MNETTPLHPVISGQGKGPTAWGLSVQQTMIFGSSLVAAFVAFSLLRKAAFSQVSAMLMAGSLPVGIFLFLAALVVNKPATFARHWCASRLLQFRQGRLLEFNPVDSSK